MGARWCGLGLGAGVGGEAGADGRSGLGIAWGIEEGTQVFGVRGGLGCSIESFLLEVRLPTVTGEGGCRVWPLGGRSLLESSDTCRGRGWLFRCSISHQSRNNLWLPRRRVSVFQFVLDGAEGLRDLW